MVSICIIHIISFIETDILKCNEDRERRFEKENPLKCCDCDFRTPSKTILKCHIVREHTDTAVKTGEAKICEKTGNVLIWGKTTMGRGRWDWVDIDSLDWYLPE